MNMDVTPKDVLSNVMGFYLSELPRQEQDNLRAIFAGKAIPPFSSGIIAKTMLNPDVSPYRLNFLLRGIVGDESIEVTPSLSNTMPDQPPQPRVVVLDASSRLSDGGLADSEAQKAIQHLTLTSDLHTSDTLIIRYSADGVYPKNTLSYAGVQDEILAVLMMESPEPFKEYDATSDRYIHRFPRMVADSGLSYEMRPKVVYVQCDKCLAQLREGTNAEVADGVPNRLQAWLSSFVDPNAPEVLEWASKNDPELEDMMDTAAFIAQDKEVQAVLTLERNARMGQLSYGALWRAQCVTEDYAKDYAKDYARGRVNVLLTLVRSGDISIETAARHLGVSADYFVRRHMRPTDV